MPRKGERMTDEHRAKIAATKRARGKHSEWPRPEVYDTVAARSYSAPPTSRTRFAGRFTNRLTGDVAEFTDTKPSRVT